MKKILLLCLMMFLFSRIVYAQSDQDLNDLSKYHIEYYKALLHNDKNQEELITNKLYKLGFNNEQIINIYNNAYDNYELTIYSPQPNYYANIKQKNKKFDLNSYMQQIEKLETYKKSILAEYGVLDKAEKLNCQEYKFNDFYSLEENYVFIPLTKQEQKKLNQLGKKKYKDILKANNYWAESINAKSDYNRYQLMEMAYYYNPTIYPVALELADSYYRLGKYKDALYYASWTKILNPENVLADNVIYNVSRDIKQAQIKQEQVSREKITNEKKAIEQEKRIGALELKRRNNEIKMQNIKHQKDINAVGGVYNYMMLKQLDRINSNLENMYIFNLLKR